jgi:Mat/Ecp fimbriae major subunit
MTGDRPTANVTNQWGFRMNTQLRRITLAATAAALTFTAAAATAASVTNGPVQAHAQIVKPLTLAKVTDLDFGTITVQDTGDAVLTAAGAITCNGGLTCSGTVSPATYKVTGTNNQTVTIDKPQVTLTNTDLAMGGTPLTMTLTGQDTVTLPNSGSTGINFTLGGTMTVPAATKEGTYQGDLNVTVNY